MTERLLTPDAKGIASITFGDIIRQTIRNFPDPRFRPDVYHETTYHTAAGINSGIYRTWETADGTGTKPEFAERLYTETGDPSYFSGLAYDVFAMVDGDVARDGRFLVAMGNVLDVNSASDTKVIAALAEGVKEACDKGRFPLVNGETAELGYRVSGYGKTRINWNAFGKYIVNPEKELLGKGLNPGQPVVAFCETSIRSNGLSEARAILETAYLQKISVPSKREAVKGWFGAQGFKGDLDKLIDELPQLFGHDVLEQVLLPWHKEFPDVTKQLLIPSRLYGPIMYDAQGGVDGKRKVKMIAAAHITGGGIPEKGMRMVREKGLGLAINPVFPDPEGVQSLLKIAEGFTPDMKAKIGGIDDEIACRQWNRGIGFMVVVEDQVEAMKLIDIAGEHNCKAKVAGKVIDKPEIQFRGHTWRYNPTA